MPTANRYHRGPRKPYKSRLSYQEIWDLNQAGRTQQQIADLAGVKQPRISAILADVESGRIPVKEGD